MYGFNSTYIEIRTIVNERLPLSGEDTDFITPYYALRMKRVKVNIVKCSFREI
jgi:hypothetical protein